MGVTDDETTQHNTCRVGVGRCHDGTVAGARTGVWHRPERPLGQHCRLVRGRRHKRCNYSHRSERLNISRATVGDRPRSRACEQRSSPSQFLCVTATMATITPEGLGGEPLWRPRVAHLQSRPKELRREGFEPEVFEGRGDYGDYFAHQSRQCADVRFGAAPRRSRRLDLRLLGQPPGNWTEFTNGPRTPIRSLAPCPRERLGIADCSQSRQLDGA
jgi:hypothetical protein